MKMKPLKQKKKKELLFSFKRAMDFKNLQELCDKYWEVSSEFSQQCYDWLTVSAKAKEGCGRLQDIERTYAERHIPDTFHWPSLTYNFDKGEIWGYQEIVCQWSHC